MPQNFMQFCAGCGGMVINMIELRFDRVDRRGNNTPILSNKQIDQIAHDVLMDYKPQLLREPGKINFEHFLENYLDATVTYLDIYYEEDKPPILGVTAFKDGYLKVFDSDNMCTKKVFIPANTVVIDSSLMENGESGRAMFTGLHEAGHLILHRGVYAPEYDDQLSLLEEELSPVLSCRRDSIAEFTPNSWGSNTKTPAEWREYQANYFAAAIAMSNATFIPFVNRTLRENDFYKGQIVLGVDEDLDYIAEELLPIEISETYGTSKQASFIKLKTCGFVIDKRKYERVSAQMAL